MAASAVKAPLSPRQTPTTQAPPAAARGARFYRPELDALRFFAFLMVFGLHALPHEADAFTGLGLSAASASFAASLVQTGGLGVDLFFVLSSYLITELFLREHERQGRIDVPSFYARRALRIWPLYYAFVILLLVAPTSVAGRLDGPYVAPFFLFAANWACAWWGFPESAGSHLWSVAIEEQFYFAWPLLVAAVGVRRLRGLAVALLVVACAARVYLLLNGAGHAAVWCNTLARLDPIACGALVAVVLRGRSPSLGAGGRWLAAGAGLALLVAASLFTRAWGPTSMVFYPTVAAGCTLLLLACLGARVIGEGRVSRALVYLGKISYGLYVFHILALIIAEQATTPLGWRWSLTIIFKLALGAALTVLAAVLSYELYEKHFLRLKERFARVKSRPV